MSFSVAPSETSTLQQAFCPDDLAAPAEDDEERIRIPTPYALYRDHHRIAGK